MTPKERFTNAALAVLVILQSVMLAALYSKTMPHPPLTTPLFAIAPFLAASLSAAVAAMIVGPTRTLAGKLLAVGAGCLALVSFGPQKYFDAQFALIWPAVVCGQIAVLAVAVNSLWPDRSPSQTIGA